MSENIELIIEPKERDLGDFTVKRVLPSAEKSTVGPFVFFDHMGPVEFKPGVGIDVRPHPHIGLATVTYLFSGEITHRDSLGYVQSIRPGDVNWMTAGRGIVHSERTGDQARAQGHELHGLQIWVGLPKKDEETDPTFFHHPVDTLPQFEIDGVAMRLIVGSAHGYSAPVATFSPIFYLDVQLQSGDTYAVTDEHEERAVYVLEGEIMIGSNTILPGQMAVLSANNPITIASNLAARFVVLGGAPLDGKRHLFWNFVSSSTERLEQAKQQWREQKFEKIPGETEFIPLPN